MSKEADKLNAELKRRRLEEGVEDVEPVAVLRQKRAEAERVATFKGAVPDWMKRFEKMDETTKRAWDERVRRMEAGTATPVDIATHNEAKRALSNGEPLAPEARRMPGEALPPSQRTWTPDRPNPAEIATRLGIPPLIAERVVEGVATFETRSTRACARVGYSYRMLVLIGERGCGKSYAAAQWMWSGYHQPPNSISRGRIQPRRFLEAVALVQVPRDERWKLELALALVVDDAGTEADFMVNDLAALLVARYKNALPTVVTTNLSEEEVNARYGMRFADRMKETGRFVVVSNDANDSLRGKETP